ncbi:helicase [Jeotgalibacillus malaysiensis]|uniref:Helicase n=1 Tax=Jeotgalibacillus malaysiensis TaxID=1508404 RepID=A0A0B5ALM8_9BACL|nr:hypothetical protein [Jeotgalibacillus malaysiensis]AJD89607.1 helicase [Jeotgalibacillus malaysiensis]
MTKSDHTYPDISFIRQSVEAGGVTKHELMQRLHQSAIRLNEYANKLLMDQHFLISETPYQVEVIALTVKELGFPEGTVTAALYKKADELELTLCPIELGPFLRLAYTEQEEHVSHKKNQAPAGSMTIASEPLYDRGDFPKGFYLRRKDGELWLRGYSADHLHVWNPEDVFIFCVKGKGNTE